LITLDLEEFRTAGERRYIDLKEVLFQGLILREKDMRDFAKNHDWSQYQDCVVGVHCSADAVVPTWAYMLVSNKLAPFARSVYFGDEKVVETMEFDKKLDEIDPSDYQDAKVVVKGCGDNWVPDHAYVRITQILSPVAKTIMYGEPCSTVPIYKKKMVRR
jgi:hypothetical protein